MSGCFLGQKERCAQKFYLSCLSAKGEGEDWVLKGRSPFNLPSIKEFSRLVVTNTLP